MQVYLTEEFVFSAQWYELAEQAHEWIDAGDLEESGQERLQLMENIRRVLLDFKAMSITLSHQEAVTLGLITGTSEL